MRTHGREVALWLVGAHRRWPRRWSGGWRGRMRSAACGLTDPATVHRRPAAGRGANVDAAARRADAACSSRRAGRYEVILVDDGSTDGTFARLAALQAARPARARHPVHAQLRPDARRSPPALPRRAGALIVTFDGDLQNDPADIPRLLALAASHDIVCGWRQGPAGRVADAARAVGGRQLADRPGDRRPAARQRLLAEGVPRRGRQAAAAAARACTAICRRSPASSAAGSTEVVVQPPAAPVRPLEVRPVAHVPGRRRSGAPARLMREAVDPAAAGAAALRDCRSPAAAARPEARSLASTGAGPAVTLSPMSYRSPLEARIAKKTTKAITDFNLIEDGDRDHGRPVGRQGQLGADADARQPAAARADRVLARRRQRRLGLQGLQARRHRQDLRGARLGIPHRAHRRSAR